MIGVAKDVKQISVDQPVGAEAYVFVDQLTTDSPTTWLAFSPTTMHVVVRTTLPLETVSLRHQMKSTSCDSGGPGLRGEKTRGTVRHSDSVTSNPGCGAGRHFLQDGGAFVLVSCLRRVTCLEPQRASRKAPPP